MERTCPLFFPPGDVKIAQSKEERGSISGTDKLNYLAGLLSTSLFYLPAGNN